MKLIILEGGDRLGKSSIIKGLCEYFNYDNVTIRHFGKPPKDLTPSEVSSFQFRAFNKELDLFYDINAREYDKYKYYPEIMIWNRSHLGEYVYSQMFRGGNAELLKDMIFQFERGLISHKVYLITLTADPEFFLSKEDGNSFSNKLEDKRRELELFKEAYDFSILSNKLYLKVDNGHGYFRFKADILNEVIEFIINN